ncbi:MAG: M48 family metalloprotease [Alphaproteobacteria bacterium]|nr:M48 family metalloprotease [Alphaproteobacteria bacterium]
MRSIFIRSSIFSFLMLVLAACGTNPVTGERELQLVSESEEINIGSQQYTPTKQAQGGELSEYKELTAYINDVGKRLAAQSHRPNLPYEFVVLDNNVPNAWALPGGKIAINWGLLLEMGDEAELAAVIGHEITHATARHGAKSMERGLALQAGMIGIMIGTAWTDEISQGAQQAIIGSAMVGSQLIATKYGRSAELESDLYGIEYMAKAGYDPQAAVRLQETFVRLSKGNQPNFLEGLFASHPPSTERVEKNKQSVDSYQHLKPATGWIVNRDKYQQMIKPLHALRDSQIELEKARKKLKDRDIVYALNDIEKAIDMAPESSSPYAMKAVALLEQGDANAAQRQIDKALSLRPNYFKYHEIKAEIMETKGNSAAARASYSQAHALLPTSQNAFALGELSLAAGDEPAARGYFAQVAKSNSAQKREASVQLARLEIKTNPGKYIRAQGQVDQLGQLYIGIGNGAPFAINELSLQVSLPDGRATIVSINGAIPAFGQQTIRSQLTGVSPEMANSIQLRVVSIKPAS